MPCVNDYNLIKEGDIYNADVATYVVTSSGLHGLYCDNTSALAYTIPSDKVASIEVEFGEYFDVCNVKYYASTLVLEDIKIEYGKESALENEASITSSGTYVYADINNVIGYLRITHSGTSSVDVQHLGVEGVLNESIGFGTSYSGEVVSYFLDDSPINNYSSEAMPIPIYNNYSHSVDVKVAVESTGQQLDSYICLSDSVEGPFYTINDFGKRSPAFLSLKTESDSLSYSSIESIYSNWDININSESYISLGDDYIQLNVMNNNPYQYRKTSDTHNDLRTASFVAKDFFTSDQSFTVSVKVRYYSARFDIDSDLKTENKVLLGITDTFPILENCLSIKWDRDYPYYRRGTNSIAATWYGAVLDRNLKVGAVANNLDYASATNFIDGFRELAGPTSINPLLDSIQMSDLSSGVYGEDEYLDGTSSSPWRELKVSYDHRTKLCRYFIDDIQLDTFQFYSRAFFENCKLFFCFIGDGPAIVQFKDFSVHKDSVLIVSTDQYSASSLYSADPLNYGPSNLINKRYGPEEETSTLYLNKRGWVSGKNPQVNDYFDVSFGSAQNIGAVRIRQTEYTDKVTISGVAYNPAYALRRGIVEFDTGDVRIVSFSDPKPEGMDGWDVSYLITTSGTIESVSGVKSARLKYSTFYDRGSDGSTQPVFGIDEIEYYSLGYIQVLPERQEESGAYPWSNGKFINLKSKDCGNIYHVNEGDRYEVAAVSDRWNLFRYADYDAKSLVASSSQSVGGTWYHYGESIFSHTSWDGGDRHKMILKSGESAWVWRYFSSKINLAAFFVSYSFFSDGTTVSDYCSYVDRWKIQYLRDGGNPNVNGDWNDIPPLLSASSVGGYLLYTQYLVDNNDGEYYTDYSGVYSDLGGTFDIADDLYCMKNVYGKVSNIDPRRMIYVEFEQTYYTQGVRLVIDGGYDVATYPSVAIGYTFTNFKAYSDSARGVYISPVFDTGTKQNTERIWTNVEDFDGFSNVLYRSYSLPPNYSLDTLYESWSDFGAPYPGLETKPDFGWYYNSEPVMATDGSYIYIFPIHPAPQAPYVFRVDVHSKEWSKYTTIDSDVEGSAIAVDPRTNNAVIYVGSAFLVASRSGDGQYTNSLSLLYLEPNEYGYVGWEHFPYQRQTSATYATMVYDGNDRVFFIGEDLDITVFTKSTGGLNNEGRSNVPGHGDTTRTDMCAVYVGGKIYVAGGNSSNYLDIYDVSSDVWYSGSPMPHAVVKAQMVYSNGSIYVLPQYPSYRMAPYMKYSISEDSWSVVVSLGYNTATHQLEPQSDSPDSIGAVPYTYCVLGDYLYAFNHDRYDFRRSLITPEEWSSGHLPSLDISDSGWFNSGGRSWHHVTTSGELVPQDRYVQYKLELSTVSGTMSPLVSSAAIVQPVTISDIPPGGNKNIYIKTHLLDSLYFNMWYTGRSRVGSTELRFDSIIQSMSKTGDSFYGSSVIYGDYELTGEGYPQSFRNPCVLSDVSSYTMWATKSIADNVDGDIFNSGNVYRSTSVDGNHWGNFELVLSNNTEGTYDTDGIYSPRVIKEYNYKMWYSGEDSNGIHRILYADSTDGISWSNNQLVLDLDNLLVGNVDDGSVKYPHVIVKDSMYWMYYEGVNSAGESSIVLCKSYNGISWSSHQQVLNKDNLDMFWDCYGCGAPCVIDISGEMHMWFVAKSPHYDCIVHAKSFGGTVWSDFKVVSYRGMYGINDISGVNTPFVLASVSSPQSNAFINARVKIYND